MSWWFKRARSTSEIHAELSREELSAVASALLDLAERAVFSAAPLVVSPGSIKSMAFLRQLEELCSKLETDQTDPARLGRLLEKLQETQLQFGEWQRSETQKMVDEFGESLSSMVAACESSLNRQDDTLGHVSRMQRRLGEAKDSQDLVQIREALRLEVQAAQELIRVQSAASEALRTEFTKAVGEMQTRLAKAEEASQTDHLTRLGNRAAYEFYGEAAVQKLRLGNCSYALAVMDLDGFKAVNDQFGHAAGDEVLNAFAGRLRRQFGSPNFVGRFGGDEFVVIGQGKQRDFVKKLEDLDRDLGRHPIAVNVNGESVAVKIGVSFAAVQLIGGDSLVRQFELADQAMYEAKRLRKSKAA